MTDAELRKLAEAAQAAIEEPFAMQTADRRIAAMEAFDEAITPRHYLSLLDRLEAAPQFPSVSRFTEILEAITAEDGYPKSRVGTVGFAAALHAALTPKKV